MPNSAMETWLHSPNRDLWISKIDPNRVVTAAQIALLGPFPAPIHDGDLTLICDYFLSRAITASNNYPFTLDPVAFIYYGSSINSGGYAAPSRNPDFGKCTCGVNKCGGGVHSSWCDIEKEYL